MMKCLSGLSFGVFLFLMSTNAIGASFETVTIVAGTEANEYERRYARLLQDRLENKASISVAVQERPASIGLIIYLRNKQKEPYCVIRKETVSKKPEKK